MVSCIYSSRNSSNSINHGHQEVPVRFTTFLRLFKLKETFLDAQIGPLAHEAKVRKWLNFHKISVRPPWSIFIITQKSKIISRQTKAIGKLTKLSTAFMFTPKTNSIPINISFHFKFGKSCVEIHKDSL